MSTTTPTEPVAPIEATTTDDATPTTRTPPGPASMRFLGWLAGLTLLGFLVRVLNVFWWRPTTDYARLPRLQALGRRLLLPLAGERARQGRVVRRPGALVPRRPRRPERGASAAVRLLPRALVVDSASTASPRHRLASVLPRHRATIVVDRAAWRRRLGGNAAGLVAAGLAAVYPQMWINDGMLLSETMAIFMTAVALYAVYAFRSPSDDAQRAAAWASRAACRGAQPHRAHARVPARGDPARRCSCATPTGARAHQAASWSPG